MRRCVLGLALFVFAFCNHVFAEATDPGVKGFEDKLIQARPLDLACVRLTGGPLKHAQDATARYLLELEPDRMMAGYRLRAGLEPKAKGYDGWDAVDGRQLTGHIAGHYLSAVSLMYAATGDAQFKERADYLVKEMKEVQDKRGNGYLGALQGSRPGAQRGPYGETRPEDLLDGQELFRRLSQGEIRSSGFDLNGMWSPWYTLHKTYAGLRDAYRYAGNKTALEVEIQFAAWAEGILAPLRDEQIQRMLNTEFGGMNEIMIDLYADTGDSRWLDLSYKFEHHSFIQPLEHHIDNLNGKHGNTQIPKLIGSADRFAYTGQAGDILAAGFFWDRVVQHHSFATGGHGKDEYFHEPDKLDAVKDGRTCETCNVYNMLKLTRRLFALEPDAHYADFQERALFNHILASIDPNDGRTCYMVPVGQAVQHEYQDMFRDFTCCVGTGMESHALHGDGIYYEAGDKLYVNLYVPSTVDWAKSGVKLTVDTGFPEGESATIKLAIQSPKEFTLALRKPYWASDGFSLKVNGEAVSADVIDPFRNVPESGRPVGFRRAPDESQTPQGPSSYVEFKRTWKTGDTIEVGLPKTLYLEPTPDNPRVVAVLWGPLVLAGDIGPERHGPPGAAEEGAPHSAGVRGRRQERLRLAQTRRGPARRVPHHRGRPRQSRRRPRARSSAGPLLPTPQPPVRDLLGPVHAERMGAEEGRVRRRAGAAAKARSSHRGLRAARPNAARTRLRFPDGRRERAASQQRRPARTIREKLVFLRDARGPGSLREAGRDILQHGTSSGPGRLRDPGGGTADRPGAAGEQRAGPVLRCRVCDPRRPGPGQRESDGAVPGRRGQFHRGRLRNPHHPGRRPTVTRTSIHLSKGDIS